MSRHNLYEIFILFRQNIHVEIKMVKFFRNSTRKAKKDLNELENYVDEMKRQVGHNPELAKDTYKHAKKKLEEINKVHLTPLTSNKNKRERQENNKSKIKNSMESNKLDNKLQRSSQNLKEISNNASINKKVPRSQRGANKELEVEIDPSYYREEEE